MKLNLNYPFFLHRKVGRPLKLFFLLLFACSLQLKAADSYAKEELKATQQTLKTVTGKVTDSAGEPIIGASVVVKGTSTGTITDLDGNYTLGVAGSDAVLIFSYIGYNKQEIKVGNQSTVNIVMAEDSQALDEVVVVAYGVQKKVNLTGSVASINSDKLESRPVANLTTALTGLAAGVSITQASGNPGSEDASIRVRGAGTFSSDYRGPMVIIDGAQGSMDSVNPDDVESVSILKDAASAAIYGSRAANGVILITTKRGKKESAPKVTYTGILSSEQPTGKYDFITDYATYMETFNRAMNSVGQTGRYAQTTIDAWRKASKDPNGKASEYGDIPNYLAYPNTDWYDALFQNNLFQKHNLSITGGSKNSNYLLSAMFMDNPGTMKNTGLKRYQFRVNVESKIGKFLKVGTQTYAMRQDKEAGNQSSAFNFLFQTVPGMTPMHDGKFGYPEAAEEDGTANNILWYLSNEGGKRTTTRVNTNWYAEAELYKGLVARGSFNYQEYRYDDDTYSQSNDMYSFRDNTVKRYGTTLDNATVSYGQQRSMEYTAMANLSYNNTFGNHTIGAMIGYEQYYYDMKELNVTAKGLMDFSITDIGTATEMSRIWGGVKDGKQKDTGAQYDYAMLSYFGRVNYSYKDRYLFEANFRRDGSSRFSPEDRWGTFPSVSAAWRISEESFMESAKSFINNLKLRLSWGKLGNTTSGYYDWQATYGKVNYSFDGKIFNGLAQTKLANTLLKWEGITSTGIGLDAGFLNNRLGVELDFYNKVTEGILTSPAIYLTMGTVDPPTKNTSDMRNRGMEVKVDWNDRIGDFRYAISANFAYNQNEITSYLGQMKEGYDKDGNYSSNIGQTATFNGLGIRTEGHMIDEYYIRTRYQGTGTYNDAGGKVDPKGGPRDGMIRTPQDLQWVKDMQAAGYKFEIGTINKTGLYYGEMIMADLNGDGIYGNSYDRQFTGKSALPKFSYGIGVSAQWKGFDFSMQWAGNGGMYYYVNERGISSSYLDSRTVIAADAASRYYYYNEDNPSDPANNITAKYPRLRFQSNGAHIDNDLYLYNATYIKLKNLQIGYTFPEKWIAKANINHLRLFLAGENLATITGFPGLDPEAGSKINAYPASRQYSVGVNITF